MLETKAWIDAWKAASVNRPSYTLDWLLPQLHVTTQSLKARWWIAPSVYTSVGDGGADVGAIGDSGIGVCDNGVGVCRGSDCGCRGYSGGGRCHCDVVDKCGTLGHTVRMGGATF